MDQATFQRHLKLLSAATNKQMSPDLIAYWWGRFGGLADATLAAAFGKALDSCEHFPSPARFNELLAEVGGPRAGEATERAEQALRIKRSALVRGFVPANWDRERYEAECRALGIEPKPAGVPALEAGV
jgi:hypothetical protein